MDKAPDAFRTISEVAGQLDVPQHVLRFWESRFPQIRPMKRGGGRRYYRPDDVDLLRGIRHLLYGEGYTIRGVQRILRDQGVGAVQAVWQAGAEQPAMGPAEADAEMPPGSNGRERDGAAPLTGGRRTAPRLPSEPPPQASPQPQPSAGTSDSDAVGVRRESASVPTPSVSPMLTAPPALADEQQRALRAALDELGECRRLLDAALTFAD